MEKTIVRVTQEHIDNGFARLARECPIALALKDAFQTSDTSMGVHNFYINGKDYKPPQTVLDFVKIFDNKKEVYPFEFEVTL